MRNNKTAQLSTQQNKTNTKATKNRNETSIKRIPSQSQQWMHQESMSWREERWPTFNAAHSTMCQDALEGFL